MAEDHPDVVFFLGDYIYEYAINAKNLFRDVTLSAAHNANLMVIHRHNPGSQRMNGLEVRVCLKKRISESVLAERDGFCVMGSR